MFCPGWQIDAGCFVRGGKKWHGMFCPGMFCPTFDVNIYIMYMRGTSHVSGSPVLLFFCWWYSLLESHWICGSNEFSNYGYVSVDIRKKRKVWYKYRDMYCSCTDPERFVRGGPTLTKVF